MEDYETVKKWLLSTRGPRRFETSKEKDWVNWLKICCTYTGKTPNELANCASVEREREIVAIPLREKGLRMPLDSIEDIAMNPIVHCREFLVNEDKLLKPIFG